MKFGYLGYILYRLLGRIKAKIFSVLVGGGFHAFGNRSVIVPPVKLDGIEAISIGSRVYIGRNSWLIFSGRSLGNSQIGIIIRDGVSISGDCVISAVKSVIIDENVLMGRCVHISDHRHRFEGYDLPILEQGIAGILPVHIKAGAWLGQGVVICPGVTIGENAVVGANSVVREDVPDRCIAAGIPAKVIRSIS